ncbi:MAG: DNA-3-methyladenine glycosylase 2 family protein [Anaerolineae bacterium]|nr:DNA-3-methyladenine glycosylase 2 family protein [Anaerolineae bacterium]
MLDFVFSLRPPVDFGLMFTAAAGYQTLGKAISSPDPLSVRRGGKQARYRRAMRVGEAVALVELAGEGTMEASLVRVNLLAAKGSLSEDVLRKNIAWMIDPAFDPAPFYALAAADPVLQGTVERLRGLRLLRFTSVFESLMVTIIEQQIALKAAQKAEMWLAETYGDSVEYQGERYYVYPTAERLAALEPAELASLKITFVRVGRMLAIARREVSGELGLERLLAGGEKAMYEALLALPGVGHWTAAWTMIRSLGHFLYVGGADVALRSAVNHYYHGVKGRIDIPAMDAVFQRYGDYAGLAGFYTLTRWALDKSAFEER